MLKNTIYNNISSKKIVPTKFLLDILLYFCIKIETKLKI